MQDKTYLFYFFLDSKFVTIVEKSYIIFATLITKYDRVFNMVLKRDIEKLFMKINAIVVM